MRTTKAQTRLRSQISAIVFHLLESILLKLASGNVSLFELVSVAEQIGLSLTQPETSKTGVLAARPNGTSNLSRDMRIPTMWYVQPAKAETSLRIRAV